MKRTGVLGRITAAGAAVALAASLAACGSSGGGSDTSGSSLPGKGKPAVTMGDKDFSEQFVLGELYAQALRAKGFTVDLKENIGSSEVIDKALTSGQIDLYPEYTGVIYTVIGKLGDRAKSADVTYADAKKFEEGRGFELLKPTPFQDADGIAVTKSYADKYGLKTVADLKKVPHWTYTGPPENKTRYQGVLGLEQGYKLNNFTFKPLTTGSQYQALDDGKTDAIAIFTTDAALASGKYAVLEDTLGIFGYQQVAPVVKKSVLAAEGPAFEETLNAVSALLTTDAIISMNKATQIDQKDPAVVAKTFLQANHLVP